jgi:hypothetical protein
MFYIFYSQRELSELIPKPLKRDMLPWNKNMKISKDREIDEKYDEIDKKYAAVQKTCLT